MRAAILNAGGGAWAFQEHAARLSLVLNVPIVEEPADFNFVLNWDGAFPRSFISWEALQIAGDKRRMAEVFETAHVSTPKTFILQTLSDVSSTLISQGQTRWALKWPTGCGAAGHRLLHSSEDIPVDWPRPFLLQEFIEMDRPEVYRIYCVEGQLFGWNARRFPPDAKPSLWVAHAQGARYENAGRIPAEALAEAHKALAAAQLLESFGCADLLCDKYGAWMVLEVNTDGLWNHVDRDINLSGISEEIDARLRVTFWNWVERES